MLTMRRVASSVDLRLTGTAGPVQKKYTDMDMEQTSVSIVVQKAPDIAVPAHTNSMKGNYSEGVLES